LLPGEGIKRGLRPAAVAAAGPAGGATMVNFPPRKGEEKQEEEEKEEEEGGEEGGEEGLVVVAGE